MRIPKAIQNTIDSFERLPGIGPKSAQRLTFYLLHVPQSELDNFAHAVQNLKKNTTVCSVCYLVGESDPCVICTDPQRDNSMLTFESASVQGVAPIVEKLSVRTLYLPSKA